ncbi:CHAT domain-containing protein [Dactylosporangium sp. NPDC048998]|uniref:CHAT domain-containing protein n=1 Tax=Dactylosporangium sp. NPDC048998 TaxID=3363976 RepID=UPI00371B9F34
MSDAGGGPAELLPMVFARPREALAGAHRVLAADPTPHDASIAQQVIGVFERDFGDASAAVARLRVAVRLAHRSGSAAREADALAAFGVALVHAGRTRAGLATLDRAVRLAGGGEAARVRFRRARVLWVLGRHAAALDDLRVALPVLRRAGDPIWTARALTLRALIHLAQGSVAGAEDDLGVAERLFATTEQEHDVAVAVHNRGLVAFRAGDLPAALAHLDDAAQRYRRLGTPAPDLSIDRCAVLLTAGLPREALDVADAGVRELESLRGQATRRAELLLAAGRAALAAADPAAAQSRTAAAGRLFAAQRRDWWAVHSRLVLLQSRLAAGAVAPSLVRQAAAVAERLAELGSPEAAQAHLLAGRAAVALGRPADADRHLAAAARSRTHGPALARATGWLAEALRSEAAGRPQRTLRACRHGFDVLERHQLTLGGSELRAQSTARGAELAAVALRACLRTAGPRRLLVWGERWRAIALAVPPARPEPDRTLRAELVRYRGISSRLEEVQAEGRAAPQLQRAQRALERRIRARALRRPGDGTRDGSRAHQPLSVPVLFDALGEGQLVELLDIDGRFHVLLCGGGRVRRFAAGPTAELAAELEFARAGLQRLAFGAGRRPRETMAALEASGRRLEELLLGPAAGRLRDGPIVVVPPGWLHWMPWALLPVLRPLAVSVAPSARAWLRARAVPEPERDDVVLVSGPGLATGPDEVAAIAKLYEQPTLLDRAQATAGRVLDALDGARLAHIAAHGTFRADSPLFSALHMVDGPVTVHDFERLQTAPYRLVLSSCDSARLAPSGADELLGLAAALLPLGTAALVASVVPVNDEATAGLMQSLHRGLRSGLSMAEALCTMRAEAAGDPLGNATACSFTAIGAG